MSSQVFFRARGGRESVKRTVLLHWRECMSSCNQDGGSIAQMGELSKFEGIRGVSRILACFSPYLVSYAGCGRDTRDRRGYEIISDAPAAPLVSQTVAQTFAEPGYWENADGQACRRLVESGAGALSSSAESAFRSCRYSEIHPASKQKNGMPCAYRHNLT